MKILDRFTSACIWESDHESLRDTVIAAVQSGANLRGANLRGADLYGADLRDADLRSADLRSANLRSANLGDADLRSANLYDADLRGADLRGADLYGADLYGAIIASCALGVPTFEAYLSDVVPALLTAGGKTLTAILDAGAWECHDWNNCPMAVAFDVHQVEDIPALYRPRAEQFVTLFDAKMIPRAVIEAAIAKGVA